MGKGDKKTKRGKISNRSYGKLRKRKNRVAYNPPTKAPVVKEEEPKEEVKVAKAPAKKTSTAKKTTTTKKATTTTVKKDTAEKKATSTTKKTTAKKSTTAKKESTTKKTTTTKAKTAKEKAE